MSSFNSTCSDLKELLNRDGQAPSLGAFFYFGLNITSIRRKNEKNKKERNYKRDTKKIKSRYRA